MARLLAEVTTADQLESVEIPGKWTELIRGELIVREPPGTWHGKIPAARPDGERVLPAFSCAVCELFD